MTFEQLLPVIPAIIIALTGIAVLMAQAFARKGESGPAVSLTLAGLTAALAATILICFRVGSGPAPSLGAVVMDRYALFFHVLILSIGLLCVLLSPGYQRHTSSNRGEHYALMLFSIVGMLGMSSCRELLSMFVALEIMSVALYAMAGMRRDRPASQEAALKYFVTGAFSSAFFLYGVALLYGVSGSTTLSVINQAVAAAPQGAGLPILGAGFLLVGFGFKVASVPFHMWAPDVYEGAPTTVTALMSAGVKAAAFAGFVRVFVQGIGSIADDWRMAVALLAALTMIIGNLGALAQSNLKRMLAYSSIAHAGYVMVALVAPPAQAAEAVMFYLVSYAAVNIGGFGVLAVLARPNGSEPLLLDDLAGLSERRPGIAAAVAVFMVSLTGIPVSGGFVGKFTLFSAAVSGGFAWLAIIGMITSVISAYYYLRVVVAMYMRDPAGEDTWSAVGSAEGLALATCAVLVLGLGIYPTPVLALARSAAQSLLQ